MADLVRFSAVSKNYGKVRALRDVTFSIAEGEILGYVGPNGAGKTTTIKAMTGVLKNFEGSLSVAGHDLPREAEAVSKILGYLPQNVAFHDWRTAYQALRIFGRLSDMEGALLEERIDEVLETVSLSEKKHAKISELSGGMKQKLGLAQAILHRSRLLVLDEPFVGLDPPSRVQLKSIIANLNRSGVTILLSSHILGDLEALADRIAILNKGTIIFNGTAHELSTRFAAQTEIRLILSAAANVRETLGPILGVENVLEDGNNTFRILVDRAADADRVTHQIIRTLMDSGARIRSIGPVMHSLEDTIFQYLERVNAP